MDDLIINGEQISGYINQMEKLLNDFINEIDVMLKMKNDLIWYSKNKEKFIEEYDNKLKEHYIFAQNIYKMIDFFNKYTNDYSNNVVEIKKMFNNLDNYFEGMNNR